VVLAPCLSSAVGGLIERYTEIAPDIELICYRSGYKGLLLGDSYKVGPAERAAAPILHRHGGSPIGNSRVKLTNVKDCVKRGLVKEGQDPQKVAADQLIKDGVDILHTIGGDDTNTAAADLAAFLAKQQLPAHRHRPAQDHRQRRVSDPPEPRRLDRRRAGRALLPARRRRAQRQPAHADRPRSDGPQLRLAHRRHRRDYRKLLDRALQFAPGLGLSRDRLDVHAVFVPEMAARPRAEAARLKAVMDRVGNVNIFISEGAGVESIVAEMRPRARKCRATPSAT
jgi:pyrophosphate--fructose-6-phosphate 1-phosphotransferase